ncbi:hypothetical protein PHLGIDRAFT_70828 [Phlebiopsis gigantea 11061_1 CR5-6]|uniref:Cytochrome P450 n=1 Tax=Phlebiopsis gigantea (strain 11061_1 CR5-6) TaxID=745531 RepID=A0A0C3NQY6_PHLG1|nr:hypothetical protein PHLGIDRAFT_70828 [Phlebiopsis gigantea 11061_1 CR5-6]
METHNLDLLVCGLAIFLAIIIAQRARKHSAPFPPGPPRKPIIGNALDFDPLCAWTKFTEWKKTYGDLVGLDVLGTKILVLNSQKTINDLLDKRGNIYSDRPVFTAVGELMGLNQSMPLMPYGAEWRACRKLEHIVLGPGAVRQYEPVQENFAAMLAKEIIQDPDDFYNLIRLCAARIVLAVTYGLPARVTDREYIDHADETMRIISKSTVPGAFLVDLIPALKYFPKWLPFHRKCQYGKKMIDTMVTTPYERVKMAIANGNAGPSLARDLLTSLKFDLTCWTGSMYGAGGETTFGTTLVFLIVMALHPAIQARAQTELDSVVGRKRLPVIADRGSLPYVEAVIQEVMRWHPMLPLSIARCATQNDVYEGWVIPKGTIVMPNSWYILLLPILLRLSDQPKANCFIPERFLDKECTTTDIATWAFGYGRRICPGKLLGESNVFILIATLLATFNILPPAEGQLVPDFEHQLVSVPNRFKCRLVVRSEEKAELARQATDISLF